MNNIALALHCYATDCNFKAHPCFIHRFFFVRLSLGHFVIRADLKPIPGTHRVAVVSDSNGDRRAWPYTCGGIADGLAVHSRKCGRHECNECTPTHPLANHLSGAGCNSHIHKNIQTHKPTLSEESASIGIVTGVGVWFTGMFTINPDRRLMAARSGHAQQHSIVVHRCTYSATYSMESLAGRYRLLRLCFRSLSASRQLANSITVRWVGQNTVC